jgi:hypothetical protein
MKAILLALGAVVLAAAVGCEEKKPPAADQKGGVDIKTPGGVEVKTGDEAKGGGVEVKTPGAEVDVERKK